MATKPKKEKGKSQNQKLILLDAHAILHRAYHALPDFASSKGEATGGLYGISTMVIKIIQELKPDYLVAAYDLAAPTYRHQVYENYKAGRKKADPELVTQMTRSRDVFTAFNIPIYDKEGFEADDVIGTIVEEMDKEEEISVVIASGDMDTLQLVKGKKVQVYTLRKGLQDTILYDEKRVLERYGFLPTQLADYKGLRGDPSDNIIGIAGIGEKTGTTLVQAFGSIENIYKELEKGEEKFKQAGLTDRIIKLLKEGKEEAIFSKMLATIRRDAPIEFKLPEKKWRESLDLEKIESLFRELEFRTLGARLKEVLNLSVGGGDKLAGATAPAGLSESFSTPTQASFNETLGENIDRAELKNFSLALWIIDTNLTNPNVDDILHFAKTRSFEKAKEVILAEIRKRKLEKVYQEIELPLLPIVDKMEKRGVRVDKKYLEDLSKKYHKDLSKIEKEIWQSAGEEFNINSPKQLGVILYDKLALSVKNLKKTAGGARSTRESELLKLQELHPIISLILKHRELQKLLSTYINTLPLLLDKNNRLHTTFSQAGTTTGRMSSNNPNLQNIPIKSELGRNIRKAFITDKGYKLAAFDYSQIELRIAAILSEDKKLIEIFKSKQDVHTAVAAQVFGVPPELVDGKMRREAKVVNFGILYGMGVNALRANLGGTREEAQKFYNEYFKNYSGLAWYLDKVKADVARCGYTETLFGRRRYFAGITSKLPYIRAEAERMAINAPIQGSQADLIKLAMGQIEEYLITAKLDNQAHLLLQVHDELIYEIKNELVDSLSVKIKEIMEGILKPEETKNVPIVANASAGDSWGSLEKII